MIIKIMTGFLFLALAMCSGQVLGQTMARLPVSSLVKKQVRIERTLWRDKMRRYLKQKIPVAVLALGLLIGNAAGASRWHEVDRASPAHHRSVFYLHVDDPDGSWILRAGYVGTSVEGDALFVVRARDSLDEWLEEDAKSDISLVSYDGLVGDISEIEKVASFLPRRGDTIGIALLATKGVSLLHYKPIRLSLYPLRKERKLELLTYREDPDMQLDLPLLARLCRSVPHAWLAQFGRGASTCNSRSGSLVFSARKRSLVGIHIGGVSGGDNFWQIHVVNEDLIRLVDKLAVMEMTIDPKAKIASLWGGD